MLAPQFSLRYLFFLVALCAVVSVVLNSAVRGQMWAVAAMIVLGGLLVTLIVQGLLFVVLRGLGWALARRATRQKTAERSA